MANISIIRASRSADLPLDGINALLEQLSTSGAVLNREELYHLVDSESSILNLLYVDGVLAGMLTMGTYLCPTGRKCWIEDVVVDQLYRGQGLGRRLIAHAIEEAEQMGKCSLLLTSRPSREAANKLYRSAGFEQRETNVYRMKIK